VQKISQRKALKKIDNLEHFIASDIDGVWNISIRKYVPLVCLALHDGSSFPSALEKECLLTPVERRFEEDPHTAKLVEASPIVVSGLDSRYFYDLNRKPGACGENIVFGREVWKQGTHPSPGLARERHHRFYTLVNRLLGKLIELYGSCLIMDVHSYNYSRILRETPLFNLGTTTVDQNRYRPVVAYLSSELAKIRIAGETIGVAENDVFLGAGYFAHWASAQHPGCLTLPLDIKKVYCDEKTGEPLQFTMECLAGGLHSAIQRTARFYNRAFVSRTQGSQVG
jgi:N-formylglutamate amidohydrolase